LVSIKEDIVKNKIFVLLIIMCLSIVFVGCSEKSAEATETNLAVESSIEEEQPPKAIVPEESASEAEIKTEESKDAEEGITLVKSMATERPEKLRIVSEMTAANMKTTMTTYYDGDKSKTEIDMPNMPKSILIHIPEEEVMYQYVFGESKGVKITGADKTGAEEMGLMMDDSLLTALREGASDDITAKKDQLDGEDVIYIEATESEEDMGEVLVKMWYSEKYATPLKYEVYMEGTLMTALRVTEIHDNVNYNADTFMPPSDVNFQEVNMDTMTNYE